jgi:type II secretory pathway pseudopilin PulG
MFCAWCGTQVASVSYAPCARCGRPTNGATNLPIAPGSAPATNPAVIILIVVGLLFFVPIMGILAAIAIPNLLTAMQVSKQKRSAADIRTIATAVEAYATDKKGYPKVATLQELRPLLEPTYLKSLPSIDGWGQTYRYTCLQEKDGACATYEIASSGKDLRFEHDDPHDVPSTPEETKNFDCDIVYSNGQFLEYPERVGGGH